MVGLGGGDGAGAGALEGIEARAIPFVGDLDGPIGILFDVTAVARIGDAELFRHERIGAQPAVVMARRALHVGGGGHVTRDALITRATGGMAGVAERIDHRGAGAVGLRTARSGVALQAQAVVARGENGLVRVRIVAIETSDAGVAHAAGEHGGPVEVFVALLTVGIEDGRLGGQGHAVVVVVVVAGLEIGRELLVAGVARRAGMHHLLAIAEVRGGGTLRLEGGGDVGIRSRAVALNATDPVFDPRRFVTVGRGVIVFLIPGHVAVGAHGIPVHAASGPVPPLPLAPVLLGEDVEPVFFHGIVGEIGGLPATAGGGDERLPDR